MLTTSVIAGVGKTLRAQVLTAAGARPPKGRVFPKRKWKLVVMAVAMGVLFAFLALIAASQTPKVGHYSSPVSSNSQWQTEEVAVSQPGAAPQVSKKEALDAYTKLPLSFVPNEGQTDKAVRYYSQGAGYGFYFTKGGAMLSFSDGEGGGHALALSFLGANPHATLDAQKRLSGQVNYLQGNDPTKWQQGLATHAELLYGGLWPGIDMAVRGEGGKLKYEFHLKPGSSVEDVRLGYRGAEGLSVGPGGELLVQTSAGVLKDAAPVSYQRVGGKRVPVKSRYKLTGDGGYGFAVGAYDPHYPLIIDPGLDYSTFLGGGDWDLGLDIAVQEGRAYVTGQTFSFLGFPIPPCLPDCASRYNGGSTDAFVTKLNASGSRLAYSTFLGGMGDDASGIAVDERGSAYVTGQTNSANYPTTPVAFDTTFNGSGAMDAFVTKLNASGTALEYSTFLGGGRIDGASGIAVDERGSAYVTGQTNATQYPTTPGAFDTTFNAGQTARDPDVFVTKLNALGSALAYSTFLGGGSYDFGGDIAVDGSGSAYVTGRTVSADFPTTPGAFDTTLGDTDAFVTKLNASGSAPLAYSTLLGGGTSSEEGHSVAVDGSGSAYVTGTTFGSSGSSDFPTTPGAFDTTYNGGDAFVTKLNASGSALEYSTFLGGAFGSVRSSGIAVDGSGSAYVTGSTDAIGFPTTPGALDTTLGGGFADAFVTKLNASGSALAYSTFLGGTGSDEGSGIALRDGSAYVTGETGSAAFPTTPGAPDPILGDTKDAFVTKLTTS